MKNDSPFRHTLAGC